MGQPGGLEGGRPHASGAWDVAAPFYQDGLLVTDLEPSLVPGTSWTPDQADADGDGTGDVCDAAIAGRSPLG